MFYNKRDCGGAISPSGRVKSYELSFDFSKAFDSVPNAIVCNKLMSLYINPYVINWIVSFLSNRKQRVVVNGFVTEFASVNRGVPQGTVLGPILFFIMVNDIRPVYPERNLLFKYADDLTLSAPVSAHQDHSFTEVIENTSWNVQAYGIYTRVVFVSEIERVSARFLIQKQRVGKYPTKHFTCGHCVYCIHSETFIILVDSLF